MEPHYGDESSILTHFQKHHQSKGDLHSSHMKQCFASTVRGNTSKMCGKHCFESSMYMQSWISVSCTCQNVGDMNAWFWITWSCAAEEDFTKHKLRALKQGNIFSCFTIQNIKSSQSIQLPAYSSAAKNPRSASVLMGFPASRCGDI